MSIVCEAENQFYSQIDVAVPREFRKPVAKLLGNSCAMQDRRFDHLRWELIAYAYPRLKSHGFYSVKAKSGNSYSYDLGIEAFPESEFFEDPDRIGIIDKVVSRVDDVIRQCRPFKAFCLQDFELSDSGNIVLIYDLE